MCLDNAGDIRSMLNQLQFLRGGNTELTLDFLKRNLVAAGHANGDQWGGATGLQGTAAEEVLSNGK